MTRQFKLNWKVSLFALICLVLFMNLGFWQLSREEEKKILLEQQRLFETQAPVPFELLPVDVRSGQPVRARGVFDPAKTLLLDNRVLDGVVGFEVLQLFREQSGTVLLVNRGFVPMGKTRDEPPDVPPVPVVNHSIEGRVYIPGGEPFLLDDTPGDGRFPRIVQRIDIEGLSGELEVSIYPHLIRLGPGEIGALPRHWPGTVMLPSQHRGYAIQWFTMALAVAIAWLAFSFRKSD